MPAPFFPLDIVGLVVDALDNLCESFEERTFCGKAIALVCKSWTPLGLSLHWSHQAYVLDSDGGLLAKRVRDGRVQRYVKVLTIDDTLDDDGPGDGQPPPMEQVLRTTRRFISKCTRLNRLHLVLLFPALPQVYGFLASISTASLSSLFIGCRTFDYFSPALFVRTLAGFPSLTFLDANLLVSEEHSSAYNKPEWNHRLRLTELNLFCQHFSDSPGPSNCLKAFSVTLDATVLRTCTVQLSADDAWFLPWLAACPSLHTLVLIAGSDSVVAALLPPLTHHLPNFHALDDLQFKRRRSGYLDETASLPSPIPVDALLAAFPPTLRNAFISGVFFNWDASPHIVSLPCDDDNEYFKASRCTLFCLAQASYDPDVFKAGVYKIPTGADGKLEWRKVP
ncbi:hypothetical protein JCM10207_001772 [Rhodosporidiobolus poonsookiae]